MIRFTKLAVLMALTMQPFLSMGISENSMIDQDQFEETLEKTNLENLSVEKTPAEDETFQEDEDDSDDEDKYTEMDLELFEHILETIPDEKYRETALELYEGKYYDDLQFTFMDFVYDYMDSYEGEDKEELVANKQAFVDEVVWFIRNMAANDPDYFHEDDDEMTEKEAMNEMDKLIADYVHKDKQVEALSLLESNKIEELEDYFLNNIDMEELGDESTDVLNDLSRFIYALSKTELEERENSKISEETMTVDEAKEKIDETIAKYVPEDVQNIAHTLLKNEDYDELDSFFYENIEKARFGGDPELEDDVRYGASESLEALAKASLKRGAEEYSLMFTMPIDEAQKRVEYFIKNYVPSDLQDEAEELYEAEKYTEFSDFVMENVSAEQEYEKVEDGSDIYDLLNMALDVLKEAKVDPPPIDDGIVHAESHFENEEVQSESNFRASTSESETWKDELHSLAEGK